MYEKEIVKGAVFCGKQVYRFISEHNVPDYIEYDSVVSSVYVFFNGGHKNDRYIAQKAVHNYMKYTLDLKEKRDFRHNIEGNIRQMLKKYDHKHHLSDYEVETNTQKVVDYLESELGCYM